jgi:hypothetical protein
MEGESKSTRLAKIWSELRHPGWGVVVTVIMAYLSTLGPELIRAICLVIAVVAATYTFYRTEFTKKRRWLTAAAFLFFTAMGLVIFFVARYSDKKMVAKDGGTTASNPPAPVGTASKVAPEAKPIVKAKQRQPKQPVAQHGAPCPAPSIEDRQNHLGSTGGGTVVGLDNAGQIGTVYVGDVNAQAGPGSTTTVARNEKSGKIDTYIMQDSQLGNESWWLYLGDRIDDNPAATKEQVADILTDATNQLKKHWSRLSPEAKAANLREWSDKQTRILSLVGTNQELFDEMHICPSFIKLATPSIPKRQP